MKNNLLGFTVLMSILVLVLAAAAWRSIKPLPQYYTPPYDFSSFRQVPDFLKESSLLPRPGSKIQRDFQLKTVEGAETSLQQLMTKKFLVVEFASKSNPLFFRNQSEMDALADKFSTDATFVVLYTRETFPGFFSKEHTSPEAKLKAAQQLQTHSKRPAYIEASDGELHRFFGAHPNSLFILSSDHTLVHFAVWNAPQKIQQSLERLTAPEPNTEVYYDLCLAPVFLTNSELRSMVLDLFRRSGPDGLFDFWIHGLRPLQKAQFWESATEQCRKDSPWHNK